MDDHYRLVFRGEVLDGQHPAVVKKRLSGLLKLTDARAERLFSGQPVTVVRDADANTAARYQKAFKDAGARLRVVPIAQQDVKPQPPVSAGSTPPGALASTPKATDAEGSGAQAAHAPRAMPPEQSVSPTSAPTPEFALAPVGADLAESATTTTGDVPDTSHLTLAEPGSRLSAATTQVGANVMIDADFELADVGVALGNSASEIPELVIDVNFELAAVGTDLGLARKADAPPPPPSTEHLQLVQEPA